MMIDRTAMSRDNEDRTRVVLRAILLGKRQDLGIFCGVSADRDQRVERSDGIDVGQTPAPSG